MPIRTDPGRLLEPVVGLVRDVGQRIAAIHRPDSPWDGKSAPRSFECPDVPLVDDLATGLGALDSHYPVLAEESAGLGCEDGSGCDTYWLVSSLAGAGTSIRRFSGVSLTVALVHDGCPVFGLVYAPEPDVAYFASEGCGAFRQEGNANPRQIRVTVPAAQPIRVGGGPPRDSFEEELFLARLGAHVHAPADGALGLCRVAEGHADLCPWMMSSSAWDTAAAQCVVEQAGGVMADLDGLPLRYNAGTSLLNPYFLVYGDKTRDWRRFVSGIVG